MNEILVSNSQWQVKLPIGQPDFDKILFLSLI